MALNPTALADAILRLTDSSGANFVGWPQVPSDIGKNWAAAVGSYFAAAGAPAPPALAVLLMDPATLQTAQDAFAGAMNATLAGGGPVGAMALDAGLAAFCAAVVLARTLPPATVVSPPPPTAAPTAAAMASILVKVAAGLPIAPADTATALASAIDTWMHTGTVTLTPPGTPVPWA